MSVASEVLRADLSNISDESAALLHLPTRLGGVGLTRTEWIAPLAYESSYGTCTATPHASQQKDLVEALNRRLARELDESDPACAAHRKATAAKYSSLWIDSPHIGKADAPFRAALRWRVALVDTDIGDTKCCEGCNTLFVSAREFFEHRPGCARLRVANATTTHTAVQRHLEVLAAQAGVTTVHEPRYAHDTTSTHDEETPDITFDFAEPITVDLKGVNPSCISNRGRSITKIMAPKIAKARAKYEADCSAAGEAFCVPFFTVAGSMCPALVGIVQRCCERNPFLEQHEELTRLSATIASAVGRIMLRRGGRRKCDRHQAVFDIGGLPGGQ